MSQNSRIDLDKKVYSKTEYPKIIDTEFSQLGVPSINTSIETTFTVTDFFNQYNTLFYDIPAFGETNSHEYLITTSTDYIGYEANQAEIDALQNEITQLRKDLLQAQLDLVEATTGEKLDLNLDSIDDAQISNTDQFNQILAELDKQPSSPTEENTTAETVVANSPVNANSTGVSGGSSGGSSGGGGY